MIHSAQNFQKFQGHKIFKGSHTENLKKSIAEKILNWKNIDLLQPKIIIEHLKFLWFIDFVTSKIDNFEYEIEIWIK